MNALPPLRQAMERIGSLPPIPQVAQRILSLKINTDEGERTLLKLIEQDPPILAKVIGLANSPLFGTSRKILNLHDAAAILGSKRIKMLALSFAMMATMARKSAGHLDMHKLWQHSLSVALTMDTLAHQMPQARRPSDEEIYLSGLLHDIGFMVLDYLDPALSDAFHARLASEPGCTVEQIEAEMLETSHGELGAELARHWNLPESIASVLHYHHTPDDPRAASGQPLVGMACMAEKLLPTFGIVEPVMLKIEDSDWQALGIDPAQSETIKARVFEHVQEVAAATPV